MKGMLTRKATELDVGNVFVFEGRVYRVHGVGEFFTDKRQGNFQTLHVNNLASNLNGVEILYLKAHRMVKVARS